MPPSSEIVEIWGGGSLFRLEPSPKDADCVFRYSDTHGLWPWFRKVVENYEESVLETAERQGLASLAPDAQEIIRWWCEAFQIGDVTGPYGFIDSLPRKLTERLIKKNFPKISVVQLTPHSDPAAWRMTLTKIWECGTSFDRWRAVADAAKLQNMDRDNLRQQLAEFQEANRLLLESIREGSDGKYRLACRHAGEPGPEAKHTLTPVTTSATTAELRKMVNSETQRYDALRGAARADSSDPIEIALESLTSKVKIKRWSEFFIKAELLEPKHVALARHNLGRRSGNVEFEEFRLVTDLHDRGCVIQPHLGNFYFFTEGVRGLIVGSAWSGPYANYSHSVLLTRLDDEREFHEWPVYRKFVRKPNELWDLVEAVRSGEQVESTPPLYLSCPYCGRNVVGKMGYSGSKYEIQECPHLIDMEIEWPDGHIAFGSLLDFNRLDELRRIDNKQAKSRRNRSEDVIAVGVFVSSEDFATSEVSEFCETDNLSNNERYQVACSEYLSNLQAGKAVREGAFYE